MKIKQDKIALPSDMESLMQVSDDNPIATISGHDVQQNEAMIREYINSSRQHLEALKAELYKVLDAGYPSAELYKTDPGSTADFTVKPSVFLEKAYTVQAYDENGTGIENRDQPHIKAGTDYSNYCEKNEHTLSNDQLLSNDASKIIGSINSAISQLNKVEASLTKAAKNQDEFEIAGGSIPVLNGCIENVLNQAAESKLVKIVPNQNVIEKLLSGLSDIASKIGNFFSNLGKSEEEQNVAKFTSFKEQYQRVQQTISTPLVDSKQEVELSEIKGPDAEAENSFTP
jgi:hypothetical protein